MTSKKGLQIPFGDDKQRGLKAKGRERVAAVGFAVFSLFAVSAEVFRSSLEVLPVRVGASADADEAGNENGGSEDGGKDCEVHGVLLLEHSRPVTRVRCRARYTGVRVDLSARAG
jgi:hypothetical protein